jgi:phosphoserine aminotransferase
MLPLPVLQQAHDERFDWQHLGMSIVEVGHRTPEFMALMAAAEMNLRELLVIPDDYHVLFLGGAARTQFATIPLNILSNSQQGGYWVTGMWSALALEEAKRLRRAYCIASSSESGYTQIPEPSAWRLQDNTGYVYYTSNETVHGVRFAEVPCVPGSIPLVADMTSSLLSEPLNIKDFVDLPGLRLSSLRP